MRIEAMHKRIICFMTGILTILFLMALVPAVTVRAEGHTGLGYEEADRNWYYYVDGAVERD